MGRLAELQRKLLEQLMGAEAMGIVTADISLWDQKACRPFICGICPHDLFTNTKMDLGACPRSHAAKIKTEYDEILKKAEEEKDEPMLLALNKLKVDYEQVIFTFVDECDRRIRAAQRRLEKTPEENNRTTALMREIGELEGAYQAAMADVEQLGSEGKVDESISQLAKAEALKAEKQEKERELQNLTETSGASGHQKLRVCDICGAYLSILDSDRRLADHFGGKMHLGYHQLRTMMDEWRARGPLPTGPVPAHATKVVAAAPKVVEAAAPVAFRPIPPSKLLSNTFVRPASPVPAASSDSRQHRSSSGRGYDDRERTSSSRRDEHRSSSSRYDERDRGDRDSRSSRYDEDRHSSSRREHSSKHDDEKRSSSRRTYEEGEEREKEKRRRVE